MDRPRGEEKVSFVEKAAYGGLSFSRSLPGQMVSLFILIFYTDVFGIPTRLTTVMLLVISIWEGFSKQLVGYFMGNTRSRHGKYRPFILWTILPYAIFSIAMFMAPALPVSSKVLYAYVIYFIWAGINNTLSVAHNSILPMISKDAKERTQINSFRMICSVLASLIVSSFALKFVDLIGGGNQQTGFALTMLSLFFVAIPIQYFSFKNLRERYPAVEETRISFKTAWRCILADRRIVLFFLVYATFWISCTFKNQSTTYYIIYVLEKSEFIGTFFMIGTAASFTMHFFVKRIISYIKTETAMCIGILGSIAGVLIMYFAAGNLLLLILGNIVFGLMSAIPANLFYIVLAAHVDEKNNQYKTNLGSWLYSSMDNLAKIGVGMGGAAVSYLLNRFGYIPNVQQTATSILGIKIGFLGGTAAVALVCLFLMGLYLKTKKSHAVAKE